MQKSQGRVLCEFIIGRRDTLHGYHHIQRTTILGQEFLSEVLQLCLVQSTTTSVFQVQVHIGKARVEGTNALARHLVEAVQLLVSLLLEIFSLKPLSDCGHELLPSRKGHPRVLLE